jgi:hypothetical protein
MDISHLFQYSLFGKLFTDSSCPYYIFVIYGIWIGLQNVPRSIYGRIEEYIIEHLYDKDECSLVIPYHVKSFVSGTTRYSKTLYSERFLAVNHYLNTHKTTIFSLIEQMNFENPQWYDETVSGFVLFPSHSQRICIEPELDIYIEVVQEKESQEDSKEKQVQASSSKQMTFRLTKPGKARLSVLSKFVESCVSAYLSYLEEKHKKQTIYEYERSRKDEDGCLSLCFQDSPFHSNKTFDNLFIENKAEIQQSIREFSKHNPNKPEVEARYKRQGIPYKRTYLLHGPPGTGKSSLIKAFLNETGRHCIMVPWSRIKTASEFTHLCRTNHKKLTQKDVILVFEDFDANSSKTIKAREALQQGQKNKSNDKTNEKKEENIVQNAIETIAKMSTLPIEKDDEFTLECVLNTLDGVHELYDAVIVFTTNDIGSLDPAFLRPGRIDQIIRMDLIGPPIIKKMAEHFFQEKSEKIWDINPECKLAPAHVQEVCIRNCQKGIDSCLTELYEQSQLSCSLQNLSA